MKKNTYSKVELDGIVILFPSGPPFWYDIIWSCSEVDYKIFSILEKQSILNIINLLQKSNFNLFDQKIYLLDVKSYPEGFEKNLYEFGAYMLMTCTYKYYDKLISQNMSKYDKLLVTFCDCNSREMIDICNIDDKYEIVNKSDHPDYKEYSGYQYASERSVEMVEKAIEYIAKRCLEST